MSRLQSDLPLEDQDELGKPELDGLNAPISGDRPSEPMPAWALSAKGQLRHATLRTPAGSWPEAFGELTAAKLAEFFPEAFAESGGAAGMPKGPRYGYDIGGVPAPEAWRNYLLNLANRQTAIDASFDPTLVITTGVLAGRGKPATLECRTCHTRDVALTMDGRCAGGCS